MHKPRDETMSHRSLVRSQLTITQTPKLKLHTQHTPSLHGQFTDAMCADGIHTVTTLFQML
jgi:hypothetical protein